MADRSEADGRPAFPVLSSFFEFWEEVEALRRDVRLAGESDAPGAAARAIQRLAQVLRRQHPPGPATDIGSGPPALGEAQYAMAATADETFIGLDWSGAESWRIRPLEMELFGTRRAGEEIFARVDRLLDDGDAVDTEMASVYLAALELGFKGKFADPADQPALDDYAARLRALVSPPSPATGPLVPECYDHTIAAPGPGLRLPPSRAWWSAAIVIVGIFLIAFFVTGFVRFRSANLEDARQRLETDLRDLADRR
jgi:type VI secretion system protein ImpK